MAEVYIPAHKVTFHLTHNQHLSYYETVEQMIASGHPAIDDHYFVSPEDRQRCIDTNEMWEAQWYPETPVGFHKICASSLEVLNTALAEHEKERA